MGESRQQYKEDRENPALQEKCGQVLREVNRVVDTYNRALQSKEILRKSLIAKIDALIVLMNENYTKLKTVNRNIEIYAQNTQKIARTFENLGQREILIKEQYELLLKGPNVSEANVLSGVLKGSEHAGGLTGTATREGLIKRRKEYLDGLDNVFKKLEEELSTIEGIRKEMERARVEISIKNEEAMEAREGLENNGRRLLGEVKLLESDLDKSLIEERLLIKEFGRVVTDVEKCVEIRQEIDHLLFSILATGEAVGKKNMAENGSEV